MEFEFKFIGEYGLPSLILNETTGTLTIYGKSLVLDKDDFYTPLYAKIKEYLLHPRNITVIIDLEYFNTVSAKCLLDLFYIIQDIQINNKKDFIIKWIYDDDDIEDSGLYYSKLIKYAEFEFIKKDVDNET